MNLGYNRHLILASMSTDGTHPSLQGQSASMVEPDHARFCVSVTREVVVPGDISDVFDFVTAEDVLPKVLTGYGLIPGIVGTSDVTGPWNTPGSRRTVQLADGSTAHEEVKNYDRPAYFAYTVSEPTFSLRHLIVDANGQWWMASVKGGTKVKWTYTFHAKGWVSRQVLKVFARFQWRGYMDVCLAHVIRRFIAPEISTW
jgi:hypothetical protein